MESLKFLEFACDDGSVWYINHLIGWLMGTVLLTTFCWYTLTTPKQVDKIKHLLVSAGTTSMGLWAWNEFNVGPGWWLVPTVVLGAGFGKEIADYINPEKKLFDWKDILADSIGVICVTGIYVAYYAFN